MFFQRLIILFPVLLCFVEESQAIFDPFTIAAVTGAAALSGLLGGGVYVLNCKIRECCEKKYGWLTDDFKGLEEDINKILYGQHLVKETVLRALKSHWYSDEPKKALVMSFHGPTGTGKNYVSSFIVNRLYKKGMRSNFVQQWIGKSDFPHESEKNRYAKIVKDTIESKVASCPRSIFIFDEVDVVAPGVIDTLKPYLDYYENINGVDYRKAVYIFLSNTGSDHISNTVFNTLHYGGKRTDVTLKDFQKDILNGAFNEKGGLQKANIIANSLVDVFVPFLPLEKEQVKQCIQDVLWKKRCPTIADKEIENIANQLTYTPKDYEYFSRFGCKNLDITVALHLNHQCSHNKV